MIISLFYITDEEARKKQLEEQEAQRKRQEKKAEKARMRQEAEARRAQERLSQAADTSDEEMSKQKGEYCHTKMAELAPNWVRLAPNGTNLGLLKISFSTFWRPAPKCTETDLKKSQICPIWGQSDQI